MNTVFVTVYSQITDVHQILTQNGRLGSCKEQRVRVCPDSFQRRIDGQSEARFIPNLIRVQHCRLFDTLSGLFHRPTVLITMGAFLEKPKTEKITSKGEGCGVQYGVSAMQGWRMEMEDAHVCTTDFNKDWCIFGVFDGHAGTKVSKKCSDKLVDTLEKHFMPKEPCKCPESDEEIERALVDAFLELDKDLKVLYESENDHSGSTAIVVMISPKKVIWANCGDSRGILCRDGKVEFATEDHKPYNTNEKARIEKAGGTVMMQRVNGSLAVSRALGDFDYKRSPQLPPQEQLVSPEPEITIMDRKQDDEFLVLACDGIYDVMSNEDVVKYVRKRLTLEDDLRTVCSSLIDTCLNKVCTVMV